MIWILFELLVLAPNGKSGLIYHPVIPGRCLFKYFNFHCSFNFVLKKTLIEIYLLNLVEHKYKSEITVSKPWKRETNWSSEYSQHSQRIKITSDFVNMLPGNTGIKTSSSILEACLRWKLHIVWITQPLLTGCL